MDHKCLQVLLLINMCITLCVALPLSYRRPGESANLFKKLFPGEESSIPDDWSKSERSMFAPSEDRSKFQSFHDEELRENLLRDILDWNKRRMEQVQQSDATNKKRGPPRCSSSLGPRCRGRDESTKEDESRRVLALGNREPGHVQMNKMDLMKMKEYDMELEKALMNLENDRPDILSSQM